MRDATFMKTIMMVEVKVVVTAEMKMNTTHPVEKCVRNIATSIHIQLSSL